MINPTDRTLDRIEQVVRATPRCGCGAPTTAVVGPDGIWLECSTLREPQPDGIVRRLVTALFEPAHVRRQVVDPGWPMAA